jgi:hypothetical protein
MRFASRGLLHWQPPDALKTQPRKKAGLKAGFFHGAWLESRLRFSTHGSLDPLERQVPRFAVTTH